jgi:hypothetical protein
MRAAVTAANVVGALVPTKSPRWPAAASNVQSNDGSSFRDRQHLELLPERVALLCFFLQMGNIGTGLRAGQRVGTRHNMSERMETAAAKVSITSMLEFMSSRCWRFVVY